MKTSRLLFILCLSSTENLFAEEVATDYKPSQQYEKMGFQEVRWVKISKEDIDAGNKATLEAIQKSSPEVKAALLKAAKELSEQHPKQK